MNFPSYERGQWVEADTTAKPAVPFNGSVERVAAASDILIWNPGPNDVQICCGNAAAVADANCVPVPAGALWVYRKGSAPCISAIARGGAQAVLVVLGEGE